MSIYNVPVFYKSEVESTSQQQHRRDEGMHSRNMISSKMNFAVRFPNIAN